MTPRALEAAKALDHTIQADAKDDAPEGGGSRELASAAAMSLRVFSRSINLADLSFDLSIFKESVLTMRGDGAPLPDYIAFWAPPTNKWVWDCRDGKPEVEDAATIAREQQWKAAAEAEDRAALEGGGDDAGGERLRGFGVRLDWLVAFTQAHDCWEWPSWRVQRDIIRPATCESRCRYAQLPGMAPFVGAATVFMSHCWGSAWGGLVMAACAGAREDRIVWIDVFAVCARARARERESRGGGGGGADGVA